MSAEEKTENDCFKSPTIFAEPRHDHLQFKINSKHLDAAAIVDDDGDFKATKSTSKKSIPVLDTKKEKDVDVPYKQPVWSGVCPLESGYYLEILKNGCIVDKLNVCQKPFYVFGRQLNCDMQLEHPSISRHHAVLQYRSVGDAWEIGWYLYDLGSTHGTFVNREKIPPHMHLRLKVGYVLKFGGSSRMYILQGPDEDTETESPLTVTEIKQRAEKQKLAMDLSKIKLKTKLESVDQAAKMDADDVPDENKNEPAEDTGINWGITDDVAEDEDEEENVDESEKIDFEENEKREQLYLDDPRKALKNFFDREGVDLKYEFFEKGGTFNKQWTCRVELPVETNQAKAIFAEASVSGGKKEACAACALEACRMLDAYGVLRKSNQESKKRKEKHWEDNDFYDSDEDIYLDRTGELERKRQKRMRRSTDQPVVDNYDSLNSKLNAVEEDMKRVQRQLSLLQAEIRSENQTDDEGTTTSSVKDRDSLDSYMTEMSRHDTQEAKVQSSRLRLKMGDLKKEADRLTKLIKISKPTTLPPLKSQFLTTSGKKPILTGSIKGRKLKMIIPSSKAAVEPSSVDVDVKETENRVGEDNKSTEQNNGSNDKSTKDIDEAATEVKNDKQVPKVITDEPTKINHQEPAVLIPDAVELLPPSDVQQEPELQKIVKKREPKIKKTVPTAPEKVADYDPNDPDYAIWLPPDDQTGDGKTSLNEKLGY